MSKLEVRLSFAEDDERRVGELLGDRGRIFFEYDAGFLQDPLWLSPFKLPPRPGLIEHRERDFGPIFGLFADSLPDGWGLLLMDRFFRQQGRSAREVSVLERLAYLGTRTMGALTYYPPSHPADRDPQILDLHDMARASEAVIRGDASEVLPWLLRAGGSPGGARPKVLVGVRGDEIVSGEDVLPQGFDGWMVKFPSPQDVDDVGAVEMAYARLAGEAGVEMPETRLFSTPRGGRYFGVRRFDRDGPRRVHVHTFGNLIHADFRLPSCDYQDLLNVARRLTRRQADVRQTFRRMVFNVAAHNRDDHVKNFAFLLDERGEWRLAPAYDLIYAEGPGGEHTTSVAGEGRAPKRRHLLQLAEGAGLLGSEAEAMIDETVAVVSDFERHARQFDVAASVRGQIGGALERSLAGLVGG